MRWQQLQSVFDQPRKASSITQRGFSEDLISDDTLRGVSRGPIARKNLAKQRDKRLLG